MPVLETRVAVADLFNPYREWLGVETVGGAPPDHYQLLGLEPFEPDAARIGPAADAAMARIRRIRPGIHLADWSLLLDRLGEAKSCLLDKASKAGYDAGLAKTAAFERQVERPATGSSFIEKTPFVKNPTAENMDLSPSFLANTAIARATASQTATAVRPSHEAASSWAGPVITGLLVMVLGMAGLLVHALYQRGGLTLAPARPSVAVAASQRPLENTFVASSPSHVKKTDDERPPREGLAVINLRSEDDGTVVDVQSEGEGNVVNVHRDGTGAVVSVHAANEEEVAEAAPKPEPPSRPLDAKKTALFAKAVNNARTAMAARDLATAKRHLKTASANAQNQQDSDQIQRLETMLGYLDQFWNGIRAAMAKLQPLEEIAVANTRIVVVESANDYLSIKAEGRVQRFKATTLPTVLILLIVQQQFGKDAGSKAIIGTFLAVDPAGDLALARRYLQEAGRAGFDAESLTTELDSPAFAKKNSKTNKASNRQRGRYPTRSKP